jgi:Protein of unknown function (DUF3365)
MRSIAALAALAAALGVACQRGTPKGVPPERVAEYLHAVIEADRDTYAEQVVHRLQDVEKVVRASERFKEEKALPLPSQMLRMGAKRAQEKGGFRYALISEWAINKANLPRTDFEREGLAAVGKTPDQPYTRYETADGKRYFMSLYADRAVSDACVQCHNGHSESPRHDFQRGEVMGGVVIALPVE